MGYLSSCLGTLCLSRHSFPRLVAASRGLLRKLSKQPQVLCFPGPGPVRADSSGLCHGIRHACRRGLRYRLRNDARQRFVRHEHSSGRAQPAEKNPDAHQDAWQI